MDVQLRLPLPLRSRLLLVRRHPSPHLSPEVEAVVTANCMVKAARHTHTQILLLLLLVLLLLVVVILPLLLVFRPCGSAVLCS